MWFIWAVVAWFNIGTRLNRTRPLCLGRAQGLESPWQNLGDDNWRDTVLSRYVRKEGPPALPVYLHYKTPVIDPTMYTRTDFPSTLEPGTNFTWWLRNGRFHSAAPVDPAATEEAALEAAAAAAAAAEGEIMGMESAGGNSTIQGHGRKHAGVCHGSPVPRRSLITRHSF